MVMQMAGLFSNAKVVPIRNLTELVEHNHTVSPAMTVSEVYDLFQKLACDFLAVTDEDRVLGVVSRGHVGFLLGARFRLCHLWPAGHRPAFAAALPVFPGRCLCWRCLTPRCRARAIIFMKTWCCWMKPQNYLGMIPVQTLVRLQTQMITEQIQLAEQQQIELQEKNQQLFRNVNELRQSRGRYEILFENSALGVMLLDRPRRH